MESTVNNQDIKEVNEIFSKIFKENYNLFRLGGNEDNDITTRINKIILEYNPTDILNAKHFKAIAGYYNGDILLRDFINRLHFSFVASISDVSFRNLIVRLAFAASIKRGRSNLSGVSNDLMSEQNTAEDNVELLNSNHFLVILLMIILVGAEHVQSVRV